MAHQTKKSRAKTELEKLAKHRQFNPNDIPVITIKELSELTGLKRAYIQKNIIPKLNKYFTLGKLFILQDSVYNDWYNERLERLRNLQSAGVGKK